MTDILIRDVKESTLKQIKAMAKQHNRSLQQELKHILENLPNNFRPDIYKKALAIRRKLKKKGICFTDSTHLIRRDRSR
jgi:plasmid stability protein